jgi:hypothetical protein
MAVYALRNPKVTRNAVVSRLRSFPAVGEPGVSPGTGVQWDTVLGMYASRQRLRFVRVESSGGEIQATVLVGEGQNVKRGEVVAYYSYLFGLGFTEYTAPCDGEVVSISRMSGGISIKEAPVQLVSNLPGQVEQVDDALGVWIRSRGDLVTGALGAGFGRSGVLEVKAKGPGGEARPQDVSLKDTGKVIAARKRVTRELLEACLKYRVAGVIGGSIPGEVFNWYRDLVGQLDWDEILARYWTRELKEKDAVPPPPMEIVPALVVTEGFGDVPMSEEGFGLLLEHAGERVFLDGGGAFQSRGAGAAESVPCLFVPACDQGRAAGEVGARGLDRLNPGDRVRVLGLAEPFVEATVLEFSEDDIALETSMAVPGVKVQTAFGKTMWVPVFNVEKAD